MSRSRSAVLMIVGVLLTTCASAQVVDTTATDDDLLRELEREMAEPPAQDQGRPRPSMNPEISVIGDARANWLSRGERNVDLGIHEVESAFRSTVDPYARADFYVSAGSHDGHVEFELEEAYLTTLALPAGLQVRAGKFRSSFGRINRTHPHALPFIDTPLAYANFLGEHGLNDQGASVSWLVPNRSFYQEIQFEVTRGPDESASFEAAEDNRLMYLGHARNFWDLTANATLELGLTGVTGPNPFGRRTELYGVDVTYIWKPLRYNTYRKVLLQGEAIFSRARTDAGRVDGMGLYALVGYQFARRWAAYGRFDQSDLPDDAGWNEVGLSGTVGWYLTEFQKLEFGLRHAWADGMDPTWEGLLRLVFVIGTHGAHEY